MGLGKSRVVVETIKQGSRSLIVAPLSILESVWIDEFKKWRPELTVVNLWKTRKKDRLEIANFMYADVFVANYDVFKALAPDLKPDNFSTLIIDESSALKGRTTQIAKSLIKFSRKVERVYCLSGNPTPNNPLEWYPQMAVLAPGVLGESFWSFRGKYFYPSGFQGYDWKLKAYMGPKLRAAVATVSSHLKKADCLDLPDKTFLKRDVYLSAPEWSAYQRMKKDLLIELAEDSNILAQNALVKLMKLRQLTSGFALDWEHQEPTDFGHSKLRALLELLDELGDEKAVIWFHFIHEGEQIRKSIDAPLGIISGESSMKARQGYLNAWKEGKLKYLLCHPQSAGHGLNLVEASHAIYFSMSHSLELWMQSCDRLHRIGQHRPVTYHILQARGPNGQTTIDHEIYQALEEKNVSAERILAGLRR